MENKKEYLIIQKLIERFGFDQVCEAIREIDPHALALPVSIETTTSQEYLFPDGDKSIDQIFAELDEFFSITPEEVKRLPRQQAEPLLSIIPFSWEEKPKPKKRPIIRHLSNPATAA